MHAVPRITLGSHYLAFVLTEECRKEILSLYHKFHEVHVCHHVTIQFAITEDKLDYLQNLIDSNPRLEINGLVTSDRIDFFRVLVNGKLIQTDQSFSHLTFTRKANARNRDSNLVLKGEIPHTGLLSAGGVLEGHFELIPY